MPPGFSAASLRFLRALKRNNDRDWFRARRDEYDRVVRGPMIGVIEQLAVDFGRFAPEMVAPPRRPCTGSIVTPASAATRHL